MGPGDELPKDVWKEIEDQFLHGESPGAIAKWVEKHRGIKISRARIQYRLVRQLKLKKGSALPNGSPSRSIIIPNEEDLVVLIRQAISNFTLVDRADALMELQRLWRLAKCLNVGTLKWEVHRDLTRLQNRIKQSEGVVDLWGSDPAPTPTPTPTPVA